MTREEAIKRLKDGAPFSELLDVEWEKAINMAIKALEQTPKTWGLDDAREDFMNDVYNTLDFLPTNNEANRIIDSFDRVTSGLNQQPCDDCISRSEALSVFRPKGISEDVWKECDVYKKLTALPSVTPNEKIGHWIYICNSEVNGLKIVECSSCGRRTYGSGNYCPNCGARMVSE